MKSVLLVSALFISSYAFAWGPTGHRIVGEIAEQHLTRKANKFVRNILGAERLSHAALWADEIKSNRKKSKEIAARWGANPDVSISTWHYVSVDDNQTYEDSTKNPDGDIIWALRKVDSVLKSKKQPFLYKKEALRMLAHYMGDLHQPLHAGKAGDRGGNYCWVSYFPGRDKNIEPKPTVGPNYKNLHSVWDSELINSTKLSFEEYSNKINAPLPIILAEGNRALETELDKMTPKALNKFYKGRISQWKNTSYLQIANESMALRSVAYPKNPKTGLSDQAYCFMSRDIQVNSEVIPRVSYGERDQMLRVADYRMVQAGIRLAHAIDQLARGKSLAK